MSEPDDLDALQETQPSREPLTLEQLLAALVAIRAVHGGGLPVLLAGGGPASYPVTEEWSGVRCVLITCR
jgi:hypothetical protein